MAATARALLPYPVLTDTPDVPRDVKALADATDNLLGARGYSTASLPTTGNFAGRLAQDTTLDILVRHNGTSWQPVSQDTKWKTYVCTASGIPGTTTASYQLVGNGYTVRIHHVASGAATGVIGFSLPAASVSMPVGFTTFGTATAKDVSAGSYVIGQAASMIDIAGAQSSVGVYFPAGSVNAHLAVPASASAPVAWASGDTITLLVTYRGA